MSKTRHWCQESKTGNSKRLHSTSSYMSHHAQLTFPLVSPQWLYQNNNWCWMEIWSHPWLTRNDSWFYVWSHHHLIQQTQTKLTRQLGYGPLQVDISWLICRHLKQWTVPHHSWQILQNNQPQMGCSHRNGSSPPTGLHILWQTRSKCGTQKQWTTVHHSMLPDTVKYVELRIQKQKNNGNYQMLKYAQSMTNTTMCPLKTACCRGTCFDLPDTSPASVYTNAAGRIRLITEPISLQDGKQ